MDKGSKQYHRDDVFLKAFGQRVNQLMKGKGITHEVFYNDTSIHPHRLISGELNITMSNFKKICDYLEISPEDFFNGLVSPK